MTRATALATILSILGAGCLASRAESKPASPAGKAGARAGKPASGATGTSLPFPYDPLCPWGRLSDGKGFVVRCLSAEEAARLAGAPGSPPPETEAPGPVAFAVELGPIAADAGAFPEGVASLNKGMEKYEACVRDNGGLEKDEAEVLVRFLVRERGRAEGATVKKHRGIGAKAAKCIADVVDRRFVGHPETELVGATLTVTIRKKP